MKEMKKENQRLSAGRGEAKKGRDRLFNLSIDMLCIAGFDGYLKDINPAWEKTLGWTNEDLMSKPYIEFVHPDDRQRTIAAAKDLTLDEKVIAFENRYLCSDGSYKWISWNAFPLLEKKMIFAVARDVSLRKIAEESLKDSEERFRATFEQAAVGIAHVGLDGRWINVNQKLCDIMGYTREELLNRTERDISYPEDLDADVAYIKKILKGKINNYSIEKRYIRKNGTRVWINLTVSLAQKSTREPKYFIFVVEEISLRKEVEEALRQAKEELEQRIVERTAELRNTNARLQFQISEHERVEDALHESEEKYRTLLDAAPIGIGITDFDGRVYAANKAMKYLFGFTGDDYKSINLSSLCEYPNDCIKLLQKLQISGKISDWEAGFKRKDGSLFVGLVKADVVILEGDKRILVSARNITERRENEEQLTKLNKALRHRAEELHQEISERKLAEERLTASEERFRNLVETTGDWVWEVNENAEYTYASPQVREILGYEVEEVLGKTPFNLMPPEEAKRVAEIFGPIISAQKPFKSLGNSNLHKNGHLIVLDTSGVPFFDSDGRFRGYRGIDRDVTEHRKMEEELMESEERYRAVVESAADAIVCLKEPDTLYFWNKRAEALFGYSLDELKEKNLHELIAAEECREKAVQGLKFFFQTGTGPCIGRTVEVNARRKDGLEFPVDLSISAMKIGGKWHATGIVRDITERKRIEEKLKEQLDNLLRFQKATVQREFRIKELKDKIKELEELAKRR